VALVNEADVEVKLPTLKEVALAAAKLLDDVTVNVPTVRLVKEGLEIDKPGMLTTPVLELTEIAEVVPGA